MRRVKPGMIRCADCLTEAPPSRKDSVLCESCANKLYARIATPDESIDGIALLDKMWRDNQVTTPAEAARGDSERMHANDTFAVRRRDG